MPKTRKTTRHVKGQTLKAVDQFTYLSSTLSNTVTLDAKVNCRFAKASFVFGRLRFNVQDQRKISLAAKLKVYLAKVISSVLYGCET